MGMIKTPFTDSIGVDSVPESATKGGQTTSNHAEYPGAPTRDGGYLKELTRDGSVTGSPSTSGPITSIFKDVVGK